MHFSIHTHYLCSCLTLLGSVACSILIFPLTSLHAHSLYLFLFSQGGPPPYGHHNTSHTLRASRACAGLLITCLDCTHATPLGGMPPWRFTCVTYVTCMCGLVFMSRCARTSSRRFLFPLLSFITSVFRFSHHGHHLLSTYPIFLDSFGYYDSFYLPGPHVIHSESWNARRVAILAEYRKCCSRLWS